MPQEYKVGVSAEERQLLEAVKDAYGLVGAVEVVANLLVWGDRVILVFAVGGRHYFLKEWSEYLDREEETNFVVNLQRWARREGVPVPRLFDTEQGGAIYHWRGKRFSLYQYIGSGYEPGRAKAQIGAVAKTLGQVHRAVAGAQVGRNTWRDDPFGHGRHFVAEARRGCDKAKLDGAGRKRVGTLVDTMEELLEQGRGRLLASGWAQLPLTPIHGDFNQFNCRFAGDQVVGVVDWDHARLAPRLMDVAFAANIALGWSWEIDYYEDFFWNKTVVPSTEQLVDWLALYCQKAPPLTAAELALFPVCCAVMWPIPAAGFVPADDQQLEGCELAVEYMRYFLDGAERLTQALRVAL